MDNAQQRQAILETLYAEREASAGKGKDAGWVSEVHLKHAHGELAFAVGVLAEFGYIKCDGPRYRITCAGVISCEGMQ